MGFLWISLAALAVGGQFSLSKVYKNKLPSSNYGDLFYNFAMGLFSAMLFAVVCLGKVGFTLFLFGSRRAWRSVPRSIPCAG